MAEGKPIQHSELIQDGNPFKVAIDGIEALRKETQEYIKLLKANQAVIKSASNDGKGIKAVNEAQKQTIQNTKQITNLRKQEITLTAKLKSAYTEQADKVAELNQVNKKQRTINDNLAKQNLAAAGSYAKLSASMAENIRKFREMKVVTKADQKARASLGKQINKENTQLKRLDATMKIHGRNVGNYAGSLKNLGRQMLTMAGAGGGLFMMVRLFKSSLQTIREFGKQNAILAGVLGKTRAETKALQDNAVNLGRIYPTLTSEITQLQIAYARLGFSQKEIIDLTESTIVGSIALNSGLEETATLVGAVVKAFDGLGSEDAPDIMDKLTRSTTLTSLNFDKLATALPKVMGAANAMNIPLEKTLSLLGIAQDATQDASVSGTSLRNIFIELAKSGQTLEEGLEDISKSQNKLTTANDKFGKRAAIVALALANNTEKIVEYNTEITKASGLTEAIADEQMNTLDGALNRVSSSWEALILSMRSSEGAFKTFFENLANGLSNINQYGAGGFFAGLLGIGKDDIAEVEKEVKAFYSVINKATKEELDIWLDTTNIARINAEEEGRMFDARQLARRQVSIAQRLWDVRQAALTESSEDVITKNATLLREMAFQIKLKEIKSQGGEIAAEGTARADWIAEEMALLNYQKDEKIKINKEESESDTEALDFLEYKHNLEMEKLEEGLEGEESAKKAKEEMDAIKRSQQEADLMATSNAIGMGLSLMEEGTAEYKILATAQALINTYLAASQAYVTAGNPILGAILAAAAVAAGLLNVAKINDVSFAEGTENAQDPNAPLGTDTIKANINRGERVLTTEQNRPLLAMGISNKELPGLTKLGVTVKNEYPLLAQIALQQLSQQEQTNRKLGRFVWVDKNGNEHDLDGNKTIYVN